ncbi:hypothetical protein PIB30_079377 [Stylosanthes scabra]|uniref:Uncharacterized protein n=1 Tax=Stylosanthes scabra TaxID=79078 RepID=A0ABU6ZPX4_9FABA|nr:hypothetical protein [Stylosanthes scabra]
MWIAVPSREGVTVARTAVVSSPPGGFGVVESSWLVGGLRSLGPSGWGARLGSGTPPGRGLAPWLRVPGAGSKFGVLLPQFPNFRLHRLHAMSQFLGNLGLIRARSTERSLGRSARSNPIEGTLSIALGWVSRGRLPILDSPESVLTLPLPVASLAVALSHVEVIPTNGANVRNVPSRGLGLPA